MKGENSHMAWILGLISAGTGILLGCGLELCFGIGHYRLIMLFGVLGGTGAGILAWLGRRLFDRGFKPAWKPAVAAAVPGLLVFALYFIWRIVPLIQEEIRFNP